MTNDELFQKWWAEQNICMSTPALTFAWKEFARAAVKALCLSDEDRETCIEALAVASRYARSNMANGKRSDRIWAIGAAKKYEYAKRRLEGR